ncbi:MAG: 30S ribosomal protein S21 [Alphaproteobacteria bacterium]|nr:30S ribosomal protein S21 [Alphaproteobacteria bacterium]MBD22605.1 30S ribosomal protein S21 [Alphaproteobacteria bacterium]
MRVQVRDNNLEKAMRAMKKKLQREGVFKEMKQRRAYEKPSEKKARLLNESTRRCKKMLRKKLEIQGY